MSNGTALAPSWEIVGALAPIAAVQAMEARAALDSPRPDLEQANALVKRLVAHWRAPVSDDGFISVMEIMMLFPLAVGAACVGRDGICAERVKDRTGKLMPRLFVPADSEIRAWCNERMADLYGVAKVAERVSQPGLMLLSPDENYIKTTESKAYVAARYRKFIEDGCEHSHKRELAERRLTEIFGSGWRQKVDDES